MKILLLNIASYIFLYIYLEFFFFPVEISSLFSRLYDTFNKYFFFNFLIFSNNVAELYRRKKFKRNTITIYVFIDLIKFDFLINEEFIYSVCF